jgi:adenine phosphoribosyltransferase
MSSMPFLTTALRHAVLVPKGNDSYLISPFESILRPLPPELLTEIASTSIRLDVMRDINLIFCFEAMSIHLGAALSMTTGIPMYIARKKLHEVESRSEYTTSNYYREITHYLYGSFSNANVLLVDDIANTGNTLTGAALALRRIGAHVVRALIVVGRGDQYAHALHSIGVEFIVLSKVDVKDGEVEILEIV